MQQKCIAHWRQQASDDDAPPPVLGDFGWYHDHEQVIRMGWMWVRSNYQALPDAGGLLDQSEDWFHDLMLYLRGLDRARYAAEEDRRIMQALKDKGIVK